MIYFYERRGRFTRCEVQMSDDTGYELVVHGADGSRHQEQFASYDALVKRLDVVHVDLTRRGWGGPHGRDI